MLTPTKKQVGVRNGVAVSVLEGKDHRSFAEYPGHMLYLSHPMVSLNLAKDRPHIGEPSVFTGMEIC